MADALISATIQVALETALSLANDRIGLFFGFKEDLASMTQSLRLIRAFLADAEEKQVQDVAVQEWLKILEGIAFEADNLLDELNYEFLRHKVESRKPLLKGKVCFFFSISGTNIAFRWRISSKVREIKLKLKNINQEALNLGLVDRLTASHPATAGDTTSRQTDSVVVPIKGRASDESRIVEMLMNSSEKVVSVIPIAGMGGVGKTTLAKSIYNNKQIDVYFDKRIWVCVSKKVQIVELFKLILVQLTGKKVDMGDRNVIVRKIQKKLGEKRYFLVLDDVWNHEQALWNDFFITLKGLNPTIGSWCLITTRLQQLAHTVSRLLMMDVEPYFLGRLPDDDCWSILKEKAIAGEEVPEELEAIRDRIIKRCDGLPLAASVIGGLLRLSAKEEWQSIVEKSLLSGDQRGIEQILKVSFDYLSPASVKKCFAYCSIFPKDTEIERESLIELWMAEGFLLPGLGNETVMENIGDKYLRVLLQSSLLEVSEWREGYYKMHDLVHDLAESISKSKSINLETGKIDNNCQIRYLVLNSSVENTEKLFENISTSLRTLFLEDVICGDMLSKFKNLHVLNLYKLKISYLPTSLGKLIHLRYIDLSRTDIRTLTESLCELYNLQTLRIISCCALKSLPKRMGNLISLRHLHCHYMDTNFQMPLEMGRLTCLQTLEFFNVGKEKGRRIEELGCLKDLKGDLEIRNLELVKDKEGAEKANLIGKEHLSMLKFLWSRTNRGDANCDEDVLDGLQPHPNLQDLEIENFMGDQFPHWAMNLSTTLDKLVRLRLRGCKRCRELPVALGQLPFLQDLELVELENIRCIGLSFYGIEDRSSKNSCELPKKLFPALKTLVLSEMENLVEWVGAEKEVDAFPKLESLSIEYCSQLTTAPSHFPSLKELNIIGNVHVLVVKNILLSQVTNSTLSFLIIEGMGELTCVSDIVAVAPAGIDNNRLQNLKDLELRNCPNLTSTWGFGGNSLKNLTISNCNGLTHLPGELLNSCTSLQRLTISNCDGLTHLPGELLNSCTSLQRLTISNCDGLTHLPGELLNSCTSLSWLSVHNCPNLVSFPLDLQQTPSLSNIDLSRCPKLKTNMMPKGFGFLTSLRELSIGPFSDDEFDWSGLTSSSTLRSLDLYGLLNAESLPDQLQYLTTLTDLKLIDFGGIEALPDWFGNLASLERLSLRNCEKLAYLPPMDAMRRLTKLNCLSVRGSPLLKESCSTSSSERSKISRIPHCNIE